MDDDRAGQPDRTRLLGYDEHAGPRRPAAYTWYSPEYPPPPPGWWPGGYPRDSGIRSSRRASSWTAAALIAGVAATTGYLAHSIPASGTSGSGTTTTKAKHHRHAARNRGYQPSGYQQGGYQPSAPAVQAPVVTSGGSGAAGGAGGGSGGGGDR